MSTKLSKSNLLRLWFIDDKISYNLYVCQRGNNSKTDHKTE